jgi:hypothetical protein
MNPFIEFAQNPVQLLSWLGYALVLLAIGVGAVRTVLRGIPTLWIQYQSNKHTNDWWAFGERKNGYIPPLGWTVKLCAYLIVLAIAAWAASALIWFVGGGV